MRGGQFVRPLDKNWLAVARFNHRPRRSVAISPATRGLNVTMNFIFDLAHGHAVVRNFGGRLFGMRTRADRPRDARNRQRIHECSRESKFRSFLGSWDEEPSARKMPRGVAANPASNKLDCCKNSRRLEPKRLPDIILFSPVNFFPANKIVKHKNMRDKNRAANFSDYAILAPQNLQRLRTTDWCAIRLPGSRNNF